MCPLNYSIPSAGMHLHLTTWIRMNFSLEKWSSLSWKFVFLSGVAKFECKNQYLLTRKWNSSFFDQIWNNVIHTSLVHWELWVVTLILSSEGAPLCIKYADTSETKICFSSGPFFGHKTAQWHLCFTKRKHSSALRPLHRGTVGRCSFCCSQKLTFFSIVPSG